MRFVFFSLKDKFFKITENNSSFKKIVNIEANKACIKKI